jgi:hypothetical protein
MEKGPEEEKRDPERGPEKVVNNLDNDDEKEKPWNIQIRRNTGKITLKFKCETEILWKYRC